MKVSIIATALTLAWSAGAFAADATQAADSVVPLRGIVSYMETRYQGEVVAVALDASGDKPAHYHVDLRYPGAGTAKLDVDATSLLISGRDQPRSADGWTSLAGASAIVATQLRGQVLAAELDAGDGVAAHYDIDVRLPGGEIARTKFDPRTRQIGWRTPAILAD